MHLIKPRMTRDHRGWRIVVSLVFLGYALLTAAWVMGNPPFAAPDEWAHYLRTIGVGHGELVGEPAPYEPAGMVEPQLSWVNQASTVVDVPPHLSPNGYGCFAFQPQVSAACQYSITPADYPTAAVTVVGTYQPLIYMPTGLAMRLADSTLSANRIGRAVVAMMAMTALAGASATVFRASDRTGPLIGIFLAVSPMVVFVGAVLNPSGGEVWAALAFSAAVFSIAFDTSPRNWQWALLGSSGLVLALSRSLGPLWIGLLGLVVMVLLGPAGTLRKLRSGRLPAAIAASAVIMGLIVSRAWETLYGPSTVFDLQPVEPTLAAAFGQAPAVLRQEVGVFGYLDTYMPSASYLAWFLGIVGILGLGYLVGTRGERLAMAATTALAIAAPALLLGAVVRHTGFGVQGRHALPLAMSVPLLAGYVLGNRRPLLGGLKPRNLVAVVAGLAATVQIVAWLTNARRYAVGSNGPILFFQNPEWSPVGGWTIWFSLALCGATSIVAAGVLASRLDENVDGSKPPAPNRVFSDDSLTHQCNWGRSQP